MAGKKEWYVLRAISGKEAKVKELLDAQIKNTSLGDYVSQVLIPTEKIYSTTKSGKKVVKERTLYSGYVFVEAELIGEVTHILRNTTNVIDFLGCGKGSEAKRPEPLRPGEVNRMLGIADELQETNEADLIDYKVGETVKVNYGAFTGMIGTVDEVNNEKKKLKVMVSIFGRKTPVELENSQVEREKYKRLRACMNPRYFNNIKIKNNG